MVSIRAAVVATGIALVGVSPASSAGTHSIPRIAFFGFQLINTSLESTTAAEYRRLGTLDDLFRDKVNRWGRFELVTVPSDVQQEIAAGPGIDGCNGCERGLAKRVGADWAAWGTVQKVSNLILNINLYMEDAQTGRMEFVKSIDIRGNTDESWRQGLDYMMRHYLFNEP